MLADSDRLAGIIDWATARVDYQVWTSTSASGAPGCGGAAVAGICPDVGAGRRLLALETDFRVRHALRLLADPGDPAIHGTIEEHLAHL